MEKLKNKIKSYLLRWLFILKEPLLLYDLESKNNNDRNYTSRICLNIEGRQYKLFTIGYLKDGGYFISDVGKHKNNYIGIKFPSKPIISKENQIFKIELKKPKLSHHIDGNAHISGNGIKSGYDKNTGKPKGLAIKSFNLHTCNDGGPVFGFHINSKYLNLFDTIKKINRKKAYLFIPGNKCKGFSKDYKDLTYNIEGYYFHKSELPDKFYTEGINDFLYKDHPKFGKIKLFPLASPEQCPYIFGIFAYVTGSLKDTPNNITPFALGGAPGIIQDDGNWHVINLLYDGEKDFFHYEEIESLEY